MKQRLVFWFALTLFAGLIFGCGIFAEKYEKSETEEFTMSVFGKTRLVLDNVSGKIELVQSKDSNLIRIVAKKVVYVKKKDLDKPFDEIRLKIDTAGSELRVESEMKGKTKVKFFSFSEHRGPKVDYIIYVPAGFQMNLSNVNGDISAERLSSNLKINLVNGDVNIDNFSGLFESEITNGEISLGIDSTTGIDIETVNGSVDLSFGDNVSARLNAETTNGKIKDENLALKNVRREKKQLKADIGDNPSTSVSVSTVNGRITLKGKGKNWQ